MHRKHFRSLIEVGVHLGDGRDEPARVELHLDVKPAEVKHLGPDAPEGVVARSQHFPDSLLLLQQPVGFARQVVPGDERRQLGLRDGDLLQGPGHDWVQMG